MRAAALWPMGAAVLTLALVGDVDRLHGLVAGHNLVALQPDALHRCGESAQLLAQPVIAHHISRALYAQLTASDWAHLHATDTFLQSLVVALGRVLALRTFRPSCFGLTPPVSNTAS